VGIDYSGGMIVGEIGGEIGEPDDYEEGFYDWTEKCGFDAMSLHYDADSSDTYYGFM